MSDTPDAPAPTPAPATVPAWHSSAARGEPGRAAFTGRDLKLVLLAALMLGLLGAAAAWVMYFRPMTAPVFYSLAVREYADPRLPPNPFAEQDSERLLNAFAGIRQQGYENQGRDQFDKALQGLRARREGPVVVHLCALARADDKQVYVLPGDANAEEPARWVPLTSVLDALRDCPAERKLLLLDVMRPLADARIGVLSDNVAERVHAVLTAYEPPFPVVCACGPGQHSHVSEEWQQSAFAHFAALGLNGAAEGQGRSGRADARVTVGELVAYLIAEVDRWALHARGVRQTPVLFGAEEHDFPLVQVNASVEAVEPKETADKYPDWLTAGWQRRDDGRRTAIDRLLPHLDRSLEDALLRADRRWRAGIEPERVKSELAGTLDLWDEAVKRTRPMLPEVPSLAASLPPVDAKAQQELDEAQASLRALLPRVPDLEAKLGEAEKARLAEFLKVRQDVVARLQKQPFPQAAARVFDVAASAQNIAPSTVGFLFDLLRELPSGPTAKTRYVETVLLDRVQEFAVRTKDYGWSWPTEAVHQALRTTRTAQAVVAGLATEPMATPWVAPLLEAAEAKRREAEKLLFATEKTDTWPDAVLSFSQAEQYYQTADARLALAREARWRCDRAYAVLPGWAEYLVAHGTHNTRHVDAWEDGVDGAKNLADLFAAPAPEQLASGMPEALRRVRVALQTLHDTERRQMTDALPRLDYRDLEALLESPLPNAQQRQAIWLARRALGRKLNEAGSAGEDSGERGGRASSQEERRELRGRTMLGLLKLAGHDRMPALQREWREVHGEKAGPAAWSALAQRLALAWSHDLPDRLAARSTSLATKDAIGRIVPRSDANAGTPQTPAQVRQRAALHAYRALLARLYAAEAAALMAQQNRQADFYGEAADTVQHRLNR